MVYLLEQVKKQFTKKLYKVFIFKYLRIKKTQDKVAKNYYFPLIIRIVKRVLKEYNVTARTECYSIDKGSFVDCTIRRY